jgi:murein DD-endopeptidase MepM/ murein hydrolase activator NlpD
VTLSRRTLMILLPLLAGAGLARRARAAIDLDGHLTQGGLAFGRTEPGSRVTLDKQPVPLARDGRFILAFDRDHAPRATLAIAHADGKTETQDLTITQRTYDIQRINGLPKNQVEPNAEELKRIRDEQVRIDAARARDTDLPYAFEPFDWPALGPISGVYGSQRILNGEPRRPHFGVDVAAPRGTPLKAPAGGIVSLADPDLFFTGGTIIIDHGHGLSSLFAHMDKVAVKEGAKLTKGGYVGNLGGTGRATGPHLHWGMFLFKTPIDPQLLVPPMPS